ncbi:MAG TPA: penicillin-binding protein 2 [Candidatus Parcubacteria bacterium]|nr:penicillin-binding protein 2 [Candidatus Parcubacteria bacterium]
MFKRLSRLDLIFFLFIFMAGVILYRLAVVQIIRADYYKALAQGQQGNFQVLRGERGSIYFRGGQILAANVKKSYAFVSPRRIDKKRETAKKLAQILNLNEEDVLQKIKKDDFFEKIKSNLTKEEEDKIKKSKLKGVYIGQENVRNYPQGLFASHLVGFLAKGDRGQYGVEGYYNDILQGKEIVLGDGSGLEKAKGGDIFLTIDYNIQFKAEKLLEKAKKEFDIEGGQIVVADPSSGEILALADFPNFDPNNYSKVKNFEIFQNSAIQKLFEPGSVFKPITMAGALDKNKITPQTTYIDTGKLKIGGRFIHNYDNRSFGEQTMTNVLEKSINTGAVFAEKILGDKLFLDYIEKFGFFEPTGIDLQGEVFSRNKELKNGREINFATASFGQGIEVTPIQLVRAFSAIANGGDLIKPYVVKKILRNGREVEIRPKEPSPRKVISKETCSKLTAMMVSVVKNGPYTKRARVPGYYIAGKTGTSQISWSAYGIQRKGYSDKTWQSFIGFAPAFNPKFLVLIKLDNPKTRSSEYSAVPAFREMAEYLINYYQIPPDCEE